MLISVLTIRKELTSLVDVSIRIAVGNFYISHHIVGALHGRLAWINGIPSNSSWPM